VIWTAFAGAAPMQPTLLVVGKQPLVIRGLHFQANEWVRIAAFSRGVASKRVQASSLGTFTVALPLFRQGRCSGIGIRAIGSLGSRASFGLKLPLPACLPASSPGRLTG
jgi:hypothetical protein